MICIKCLCPVKMDVHLLKSVVKLLSVRLNTYMNFILHHCHCMLTDGEKSVYVCKCYCKRELFKCMKITLFCRENKIRISPCVTAHNNPNSRD